MSDYMDEYNFEIGPDWKTVEMRNPDECTFRNTEWKEY